MAIEPTPGEWFHLGGSIFSKDEATFKAFRRLVRIANDGGDLLVHKEEAKVNMKLMAASKKLVTASKMARNALDKVVAAISKQEFEEARRESVRAIRELKIALTEAGQ